MIKKYNNFIIEKISSKPTLKYYSFDMDDNIVFMNTKIIMEHIIDGEWVKEDVSTEKFAEIRTDKDWRFLPGEESFINFRDYGKLKDETFITDFKYAILNKKFAPSFTTFLSCLINGNIFAIITSRGHSPKNVKKAIYWLIYEYGLDNFKDLDIKNVNKTEPIEEQMIKNLLRYYELFNSEPEQVVDSYIDMCPIYTVTSPEFLNQFGVLPVEQAKKVALSDFNEIVKDYADELGVRAEYGFSDDDPKFVKAAIDKFSELKPSSKNIKYSVFDTGNKDIKKAYQK